METDSPVLVCYDGSEGACAALDAAVQIFVLRAGTTA
jgi:hypothetical protein